MAKKLTVKEKILNFLSKRPIKRFSPTKIATATRSNYNTVRRCLQELLVDKNAYIKNDSGSYYYA